jgi:hypothetical protein
MFTFRTDESVRWDSHPEFGILCPSPRRRRRIRTAMVSALAIIAAGAMIKLAGAHRQGSDLAAARATEGTEQAAVADHEGLSKPLAAPSVLAQSSTSAADVGGLTAPPQGGQCKESSGPNLASTFLNPVCGQSHLKHAGRNPHKVLTVIIGRSEPPPASETSVAAAPTDASHPSAGAAGSPATTQPIEHPASLPKKKTTSVPQIAATPAQAPAQPFDPFGAFAAARQRPGAFERSATPRATAAPPRLGNPFGGIW